MMIKSSYLRSIFTFMNVELSYLRVSPNNECWSVQALAVVQHFSNPARVQNRATSHWRRTSCASRCQAKRRWWALRESSTQQDQLLVCPGAWRTPFASYRNERPFPHRWSSRLNPLHSCDDKRFVFRLQSSRWRHLATSVAAKRRENPINRRRKENIDDFHSHPRWEISASASTFERFWIAPSMSFAWPTLGGFVPYFQSFRFHVGRASIVPCPTSSYQFRDRFASLL